MGDTIIQRDIAFYEGEACSHMAARHRATAGEAEASAILRHARALGVLYALRSYAEALGLNADGTHKTTCA